MTGAPPTGRSDTLLSCERPPAQTYDTALLDLDGVVYVGPDPVETAPAALAAARRCGMRLAFVTNNASRTPDTVADHLTRLGVPAGVPDVVTSAQATARLLLERLGPGGTVLVVGGDGLRQAVRAAGLREVAGADDRPDAVAQGYTPDVGYRTLAEAALAVRRGAWWVASNTDVTLPSRRGLLPGNGALVALVRAATGREPVVAGKPELPLHREAVLRTGARRPLVVGDRLDTDIEGAVRAGTDSLLVLTGVTTPRDLMAAERRRRPSYVAPDLTGLLRVHQAVETDATGVVCGGWRAYAESAGRLVLERVEGRRGTADGDALSDERVNALRALSVAAWRTLDGGDAVGEVTGDVSILASLQLL